MWKRNRYPYRAPEEGGDTGGASGGEPTAAPAGAPASAPASAPAATPATPVAAPAASAAASPAPAASTPDGAPAATPATPAADGDTKPADGYWPADWRTTISKGDAKLAQRLGRYASPEAMAQALIAAQTRISSGELKPVLGKNPTPEQLAEYREAMGIPESPEKYDLGDAAKLLSPAARELLLAEAHATNQTPAQVQASLRAYQGLLTKANELRHENDLTTKQACEDALREEWGPEFRKNTNLVHALLDGNASQPLKDQVLNARLPDGTLLGSSPDVMRMLVGLALIQNPAGVVVPGAEANPLQGVEDEITKIETFMKKDRPAYNKDERMQARYRELLGARETLKPRKAA